MLERAVREARFSNNIRDFFDEPETKGRTLDAAPEGILRETILPRVEALGYEVHYPCATGAKR